MTTSNETVGCVAAATAILGDKWTPLLLRCFMNEPTLRFCHLQDLTNGINPRTLSARLVSLEQDGIIIKTNKDSTNRCEYSLTQKGRDLMPILRDMQRWGEKHASLNHA